MKDFTELRGASYAREFYERAINKIMDQFQNMEDAISDALVDLDDYDIEEKSQESYNNYKAKLNDLAFEIVSFADSFLQRH